MDDFKNKYGPWAVITGATDGIGLAMAELLALKGLNLVLIGRRENLLAEISKRLEKQHSIKTAIVPLDVSSISAMQILKEKTSGFDVGLFIAAAGYGTSGSFVDQEVQQELNMIDVNCNAVVEQTHFFANQMTQKKRGGIILFSSLVAFQGTPYSAVYSATKSFIQNFAEALHVELKPYGVDVLATAPGPVSSGFASRARMTMGSTATAEEVAKVTLKALGSAMTVRPGFLSKFLGYSLMLMNRWGRIQVMKKIMGKMANE